MEISSIHCLSQTVRAIELKFWEKAHPPPYVTCHVSQVMCHMSCVTCHLSHFMCHMSHVTCYMSHTTCHMLYVIFFFIYFFWQNVQSAEGLLSTKPTPSSFFAFWFLVCFLDFTKQLILEISFATSLLLMMGELAGAGSVCVCGCCRYH